MAKIGILFPEEQMVQHAREAAIESELEIVYSKAIDTVDSVNEARLAIDEGAQILLARGKQAMLIKQVVNLPIVEVKLTTQEIGLLLETARNLTKKEKPRILLICYQNMLPDMTYMEQLFQVELEIRYILNEEDVAKIFDEIEEWIPDIVIGGKEVCEYANNGGYIGLYYSTTSESVKLAVQTAKNMSLMLESQMQSDAQFETMMDTSFNGIIRLNREGTVVSMNQMAEESLGKKSNKMIGNHFSQILPQLEIEPIDSVINGEMEQYSTSVRINEELWLLLIAPIKLDLKIRGAIISMRKSTESMVGINNRMLLKGYTTEITFEDIPAKSKSMKQLVSEAKVFSMSDHPVLIHLPMGTDGGVLAKAIHNNSRYKNGPFVSLDLSTVPAELHREVLMGKIDAQKKESRYGNAAEGAFYSANHGSIYLKNVEMLSLEMQRQIVRLLLPSDEINTDVQTFQSLNFRIIVSSRDDLRILLEEGKIDTEFFYAVSCLKISIPPIKDCPEELKDMIYKKLRFYMKKYNKYLRITEGGYRAILGFAWDGNELQVESFVERLVLSADKRNIDEVFLKKLYESLYPDLVKIDGVSSYVTYRSPEAAEIENALRDCGGNRQKAALSLGISTTTLWRKIKKFGLDG